MTKIKAVLFDLDGTLLNTIDDLGDAANYMLTQFGYPTHDIESYKYRVGNGMRKLMERSLPDGKNSEDEIDRAMEIFMPYYNRHSLDKTRPYEGMHELIETLRKSGIKTAVVTNKAEQSAVGIIKRFYDGCFDVVIGQRDNMPTKPDPAGAHLAMSELGVTPDECIFMGDSGVDILTAKNSGAYPVGVLWGFRKKDELVENGANIVISTPSELLKVIEEIE